jgi:hypothetical protein
MKKLAAVAILAAAAVAPAYAQFVPYGYIGGGAGNGHLNVSGTDLTGLNDAQVDDKDTAYTVRTGFRFHQMMAIELGYYDLGSYAFHGSGIGAVDGTARAKSFGISFVGILPMQNVDLYGRIGFARSELKVNASTNLIGTPFNSKEKQNEATYGVGARWNFGRNLGVFAEWMKNDKIEVDAYMMGVDFKF